MKIFTVLVPADELDIQTIIHEELSIRNGECINISVTLIKEGILRVDCLYKEKSMYPQTGIY